jgi:hypothetical protein
MAPRGLAARCALPQPMTRSGQTFPVVAVQVTTDDAGAFSVALESGLDVAYMVRLPSRRDTFNIVVPDGGPTTLETLRAAYVGVPAVADNLETLLASLLADPAVAANIDHAEISGIGTTSHPAIDAALATSAAHIANTANPHAVTKAQVGLGSVDNTADSAKPVSTAQQTALNAKADTTALTAHTGNTANPHAVTKAQVGLGNVDNTSDSNKPVSTAQQTALDAKQPLHANLTAEAGLTGSADRVSYYTGVGAKTLATLTTYGRSLIAAADAAATKTLLALAKADVGLGNVDNTSDVNKPVSTAQQAALDAKAALSHTHPVTDILDLGRSGYYIKDDFTSRLSNTQVGEMQWGVVGAGSTSGAVSSAGHPGIVERDTGATSGTIAGIRLANASLGSILPAEFFDMRWTFRLNHIDTDTAMRCGFGADSSLNPPANGIYVEKVLADASWFGVTRDTSVQTRTAALAACDTGWHSVRIRRVDASTIGFTFDAASEVTATATIPTAAMTPFLQIINGAAASKNIDIDLFSLRITGLNR